MEITLKINADNCNTPTLKAWLNDFADICDANFGKDTYGYDIKSVITDDKVLPKPEKDKQEIECNCCDDDDYDYDFEDIDIDAEKPSVKDTEDLNHSCHCKDCNHQKENTVKGTDKLVKLISDMFDFPWGIF